MQHRPIYEIAADISRNWPKPFYGAKPYLDAMHTLVDKTSKYGYDGAYGIICYFLSNAATWKGPDAKRIKAELRAIIK